MLQDARNTDVIFVCSDSSGVAGHKFVLAAACPQLRQLLSADIARVAADTTRVAGEPSSTCHDSSHVPRSVSRDSVLSAQFGSSTVCPASSSSYK